MSTGLAVIFGAGNRVGKAVALKFLNGGYKVAVVSRSGAKGLDDEVKKRDGFLKQYSADLGKAGEAVKVWNAIKKDFSSPISFVLYNAAANFDAGAGPWYTHSASELRSSFEVNTMSVYDIAGQAIQDFQELPESASKTFIFTGNGLDDHSAFARTPPNFLSMSMGKSSTAILIDAAAQTFVSKGLKFYYIDERLQDGNPAYSQITGDGHADICWALSEEPRQSAWRVKFTNGVGKL